MIIHAAHRPAVPDLDIAAHLDGLAKPPGSLGRLERLAARLARTQGTLRPRTKPRRLIVFAGDHGVVEDGVGIWPSAITGAMIRLIVDGRSASRALARACDCGVVVIDAGSKAPALGPHPDYRDWRVAHGSRSLAREPALTADQFKSAWDVGTRAAREALADGIEVIAVGEMGIGNTTAAACLIALLADAPPERVVGPGAGATPASLSRKTAVIADAVARARVRFEDDQIAAIAAVSGFEIAALAGCIATAEDAGKTVVLDGVITAAAALIARHQGATLATAIAAHVGAEPGHSIALDRLGLESFLDWDLRLGEGTGALLLLPLLDAARELLTGVATLADVAGQP